MCSLGSHEEKSAQTAVSVEADATKATPAESEVENFVVLKPGNDIDKVFQRLDPDNSGQLDKKGLENFFREAFPDQSFEGKEFDTLMSDMDFDSSGTIAMNELRAFLRYYDPKTKIVNKKSALIVIDVQNDFITGTLANPYEAKGIVPIINKLRDMFDVVVISYDWHPEHHCSFVESAREGKVALKWSSLDETMVTSRDFKPFSTVTLEGDNDRAEHPQMLFPRHAVQNTEGSACPPDLIVKDSDIKIYKGTKANIDSYSAFFDNCKANDTGMLAALEKEAVTDIYCVGLVFDICVMSSALHGAELGFRTRVIEEACRPLEEDHVGSTKEKLAKAGVAVQTVEEALKEIKASKEANHISIAEYLKVVRQHRDAKCIHNEVKLSSHGAKAVL